jgi:hypothetical protein
MLVFNEVGMLIPIAALGAITCNTNVRKWYGDVRGAGDGRRNRRLGRQIAQGSSKEEQKEATWESRGWQKDEEEDEPVYLKT